MIVKKLWIWNWEKKIMKLKGKKRGNKKKLNWKNERKIGACQVLKYKKAMNFGLVISFLFVLLFSTLTFNLVLLL